MTCWGNEMMILGAAEAVNLFCYQARKWIGGLEAALGGVDMLVFAGGHWRTFTAGAQPDLQGLEFLGIRIDAGANEKNAAIISEKTAAVRVRSSDGSKNW